MRSNISPAVAQATERRAQAVAFGEPAAPAVVKPEVVAPVAAPQEPDEQDPAPELHGNAVQADPENDNPPTPPEDGEYGYQTRVVITPARAQALLEMNAANNRNKKESKITQMARDMRKNFWRDKTGETLKISKSGFMIDGQNRMNAVIRSGVTVVVDIAWNVPDDRILVIDGNSPRTTSDDFKFRDIADRFVGGPLVRWVVAWEKGNPMNHGGRLTPTRSEIQDRYLKEPSSFDTAAMFGRAAHQRIASVNSNAAAMAFWLFSKMPEEGAEKAEEFFDQFLNGLGLTAGSPIGALRDRFIANKKPLHRTAQVALMIRAWNAFRTGRSPGVSGRVSLGRDPLTNANFPMPV